MNEYFLGVDLGGTFTKMGVVSAAGEVLSKTKFPTEMSLNAILTQVQQYIDQVQAEEQIVIKGIGISLPGVMKADGTMQTAGAIKSLIGFNVRKHAAEFFQLPVAAITDSKAAALAESWHGNGKAFDNFVCLTLGSAVGGAIVINRQLYWGLGGLAGEFGVALMDRKDPAYKLDSTSLHAGVVGGLCRKYSLAAGQKVMEAEKIFAMAEEGQPLAQKYVSEFFDDVARLVVNVSVSLAPEAVLIGGGISENKQIMACIESVYKQVIQDYSVLSRVQMPKLLPCFYGNDAGIIGAVKQVIDTEMNEHKVNTD